MNANTTISNRGKILAVVAVLAMVVCAFAAIMPAEQTDAAPGDTLYISGTIDKPTDYNGNTVVVDGDLSIIAPTTIGTNTTLVINKGVTVTIEDGTKDKVPTTGSLIIAKDAKAVTVNGDIVIDGKDSILAVASAFNNGTHEGGIVVNSTGSITASNGGWIASQNFGSDSTDCGSIVLKSGATLDITKRSNNVSAIRSIEVVMYEGSTFNTEGYFKNVVIRAMGDATYFTGGSAYLTNNEVTTDFRYLDNRNTSDLTFTVTNQSTTAYYTDTTADNAAKRVTLRQYTLNVDGTLDGYTDGQTLCRDYLVVTPATIGTEYNPTGDVSFAKVNGSYVATNYFETEDDVAAEGAIAMKALATITGSLTVSDMGKITLGSKSDVTVSGTMNIEYDEDLTFEKESTQFNGYLYVTGTVNADVNNIQLTSGLSTSVIYVNGGTFNIIGGDYDTFKNRSVYGAGYLEKTTQSQTFIITDLATAVTEAAALENEVYIYGLTGSDEATINDLEDAVAAGAYVINGTVSIPDGMDVYFYNATYIPTDATLTFEDGANANDEGGKIIIDGKLVDRNNTFDYNGADQFIIYEVRKANADESEVVYTTLAIALSESQAGETINLNGAITITEDITIPADVTVVSGEGITVLGATVTVNGILDMDEDNLDVNDYTDPATGNVNEGAVVVNNYIANVFSDDFTDQNIAIPGAYFQGQIREDDSEGTSYISSAAVAGQYSTTTGQIDIVGKISMGTVAFTQGEDPLTVTLHGDVTGDVTMNGEDVTFEFRDVNGSFTGSVTYAATAGNAVVNFNDASVIVLESASYDDGTSTTTTLNMYGMLYGSATISEGTVYVSQNNLTVMYAAETEDTPEIMSVLTVAAGATLNVPEKTILTVNATGSDNEAEAYAGLVVDGTLVIDNGRFVLNTANNTGEGATYCDAQADINGNMDITGNQNIAGIMNVTGTVTVSENSTATVAKMYVGDIDGASGTIAGAYALAESGFVVAYPNAVITDAAIDENVDGTSNASVTEYYVNGDVIMTSYAYDGTLLNKIIPEEFKLTGYEPVNFSSEASNWYASADMSGEPIVYATAAVDDYAAVYAEAELSQALVYVSVGSNLSVYIDDVRYSNGAIIALDVGQHTIAVQTNPGYAGETSVLIGGTAVTGGTFEITPEMAEEYGGTIDSSTTSADCVVVSVTGNVTVDVPSTGGDSGSDGLGLTDYLLIILVILIVVMAIMVAMRLMRS